MKKILCVFVFLAAISLSYGQSGRFLQAIFDEVNATYSIKYSEAYQIIGATDLTSLYLDFYEPANDAMAYRPLVITVFGGSFVAGHRKWVDMTTYADSLVRLGYVVASIDYRLLSIFQVTTQNLIRGSYAAAQDINAAIRFFKSNYEPYGVDTTQIYLLGNSSGSIASLIALYLDNDERPAETYLNPDMGNLNTTGFDYYATNSGSVAGVISPWGGIYDLNMIDASDNAPVCLIHGTADETVPYESGSSAPFFITPIIYGSHPISLRLDSLGIEHEFHSFIGEEHAFHLNQDYTLNPEKFNICFHIMRNFLAHHNSYVVGVPSLEMPDCTLSIYPNPVTNQLHINLSSNVAPTQGRIYAIDGTILKNFEMTDVDKTINVQDLPVGVYILSLQANQHLIHKKFIKK